MAMVAICGYALASGGLCHYQDQSRFKKAGGEEGRHGEKGCLGGGERCRREERPRGERRNTRTSPWRLNLRGTVKYLIMNTET